LKNVLLSDMATLNLKIIPLTVYYIEKNITGGTDMRKINILLFGTFMCLTFTAGSVLAENEVGNVIYSRNGNNINAQVDVKAEGDDRILILCGYKNGFLHSMDFDKKNVDGSDTLSVSLPAGVDEMKASVMDAFDGRVLNSVAAYGADSTDLDYIKVEGVKIPGYSNEIDEYKVKVNSFNAKIEACLSDGTGSVSLASVEASDDVLLNITSSRGRKRQIKLKLYNDERDTYSLSSLKYKLGDTEYEIDGFERDKLRYDIELPDNTMSVVLIPQTVGDIKTKITDTEVTEMNGVSLGTMGDAKAAYQYTRLAVDNMIPIKNEQVTASIEVSNGENTTTYTIGFKAKQPRLTSFEYVGAADDSLKPVFVGGSAVNNDNGTIFLMDRRWAAANISEAYLGGSCFMFPNENKESNKQWWSKNASGEYFNFSADTSGTVYVASYQQISNSQYNEGWTKLNGETPKLPEGVETWLSVAKNWNGYTENKYFINAIEYKNDEARAINPHVKEIAGGVGDYANAIPNVAYRTFNAGETVSVFHTGKQGTHGAKVMVVVVWDDVVHTKPEIIVSDNEQEELLPELPPVYEVETDFVLSVEFNENTDTTDNKWYYTAGNEYISLNIDDNNKWTDNGFMVTGGQDVITLLPSDVADTVNSNIFTLEFEISELNPVSGKNCAILTSPNGEFAIYKNKSNNKVYFKWGGGTTALKWPVVNLEDMLGKKNTIVVDKEASKIVWYIDGVSKSEKSMSAEKYVNSIVMSGQDSTQYGGSVVFNSLAIYDKAKTADEIAGGNAQ